MTENITCPVDFITVNENKVRLTALSVFILIVLYVAIPQWYIPAFLTLDFFLRGFNFGKYSLLNIISDKEVKLFAVSSKPIDQAPKRFAAKIGFVFSAAITALTLFNFTDASIAAILLAIVLSVFAFLESFMGICAGCYAYTFYIKLFGTNKKQAVKES